MDGWDREGIEKKRETEKEGEGGRIRRGDIGLLDQAYHNIISFDPQNNWTLPFPFCILDSPGLGESYNLPKIMSNKVLVKNILSHSKAHVFPYHSGMCFMLNVLCYFPRVSIKNYHNLRLRIIEHFLTALSSRSLQISALAGLCSLRRFSGGHLLLRAASGGIKSSSVWDHITLIFVTLSLASPPPSTIPHVSGSYLSLFVKPAHWDTTDIKKLYLFHEHNRMHLGTIATCESITAINAIGVSIAFQSFLPAPLWWYCVCLWV